MNPTNSVWGAWNHIILGIGIISPNIWSVFSLTHKKTEPAWSCDLHKVIDLNCDPDTCEDWQRKGFFFSQWICHISSKQCPFRCTLGLYLYSNNVIIAQKISRALRSRIVFRVYGTLLFFFFLHFYDGRVPSLAGLESREWLKVKAKSLGRGGQAVSMSTSFGSLAAVGAC
jgi:hypothetical protein